MAAAIGLNIGRLDLYFLFLFSLTVLIGLRFMGTLLASALIILPAAAARQLTGKLLYFLLVSSAISVVSVIFGFLFDTFLFRLSTVGPAIVISSALLFGLTLIRRPRVSQYRPLLNNARQTVYTSGEH